MELIFWESKFQKKSSKIKTILNMSTGINSLILLSVLAVDICCLVATALQSLLHLS